MGSTFDVAACGEDFDHDFVGGGCGDGDVLDGCVQGGGWVHDCFAHCGGLGGCHVLCSDFVGSLTVEMDIYVLREGRWEHMVCLVVFVLEM